MNFIKNIFFVGCLIAFKIYGQHVPTLSCKGEIPDLFRKSLAEHISETSEDYADDHVSENLEKGREELMMISALNYESMYDNGIVLFGDEISVYLNKVKDELLKDDPVLREKIQVFTLRSAQVNAYSTLEGGVFFTIGLLARLENEAEIAVILAHEIAHFTEQHVIKNAKTTDDIDKLNKKRKTLSFDDRLKIAMQRSKEDEFAADSLGFILFSKSNYSTKSGISVLEKLGKADLPIFQIPFDKAILENDYLKIPECFFLDEVNEITDTEHEDDTFHSHPNISKRKEQLIRNKPEKDNVEEFIISKEGFQFLTYASRFELLRLLLIFRNYDDGLYLAYALMKEYPQNEKYLKTLFAKTLFAISRYKNENELRYAMNGYYNMQGESQQVNYFLKSVSRKQLCSIALQKVYEAYSENKTDETLKLMAQQLVDDLVIKNKVEYNYFYDEERAKTNLLKTSIDSTLTKLDKQIANKNFYKFALVKERRNENLKTWFQESKEKKNAVVEAKFKTLKEIKKEERLKAKERENEIGLGFNRLDILEPEVYCFITKKEGVVEKKARFQKESKVVVLDVLNKNENKGISFIQSSNSSNFSVEKYNHYSQVKFKQHQIEANLINMPLIIADSYIKDYRIVTTKFLKTDNLTSVYCYEYDVNSNKVITHVYNYFTYFSNCKSVYRIFLKRILKID